MRIGGKTGLYHKLVYEVRYEHGLVYLDRCGTTANRIMQTYPDWIVLEDSISPQQAPLVNVRSGMHFNFGPFKYDFSLDQPINREATITEQDVSGFIGAVESVSAIIHEELELESFVREGFRVLFLFGTDSEEAANNWILDLGAVTIAPALRNAFEGGIEGITYAAVVKSDERKYRISVSSVERVERLDVGSQVLQVLPRRLPRNQRQALLQQLQARHRLLTTPQFGALIDIDAFVERPVEIAAGDFIRHSLESIEANLPLVFSGGNNGRSNE